MKKRSFCPKAQVAAHTNKTLQKEHNFKKPVLIYHSGFFSTNFHN